MTQSVIYLAGDLGGFHGKKGNIALKNPQDLKGWESHLCGGKVPVKMALFHRFAQLLYTMTTLLSFLLNVTKGLLQSVTWEVKIQEDPSQFLKEKKSQHGHLRG